MEIKSSTADTFCDTVIIRTNVVPSVYRTHFYEILKSGESHKEVPFALYVSVCDEMKWIFATKDGIQ